MLPPSEYWPLDASLTWVRHLELQHQLQSQSVGQSHSLCSQWSGELGSGCQRFMKKKKKKKVYEAIIHIQMQH